MTETKVTLYWLEQSRSQRILWLLEELKIDYELKTFKRGSDMLAPKELKEAHPLGKSPVIGVQSPSTDKPLILAESGFIAEYLCDHFNGEHLVPKRYKDGKEGQVGGETEEWLRFRYFMHYAEGSLMPLLVIQLIMNTSKVESMFLHRNLDNHFRYLEEQLKSSPGGGEYLCGNQLTAADILMSFPMIAAMGRLEGAEQKYPKVKAYSEKLQATEGYKKAAAKIEQVEGKFQASL